MRLTITGKLIYSIYRSASGKYFGEYQITSQTEYVGILVTPCKKYYYAVEACSATCSDFDSNHLSDSGSAVPISAPTLSVTKSGVRVKLSWNKIAGVTKYWVYRSTDGVNYEFYDKTYDTKYTNNSVYVGTRYYYKVKAVVTIDGEDYSSSHSNAVNIIP